MIAFIDAEQKRDELHAKTKQDRPGYELVAAGMLIMAGGHDGKPLDSAELERWTRIGYERGMRFRKGER